jgi:DNA repair photolyase
MSPAFSAVLPDPTPTLSLFPECPEHSPNARAPELAQLCEGPRGELHEPVSADCPPQERGAEDRPHPARETASAKATKLVGIARLAASSPPVDSRRASVQRPEYFVLPVRSMLNRCDSNRVPFEWTINPYRGCEFGCKYCFARYTHEYMELDAAEFEKRIYVKQGAEAYLPQEIARKYSYESEASGGMAPEHIAIGTATDPYQPAEREYGVTRACLEELVKREGLSISITTKSNQILRDVDLLSRIAEKSALFVNMTVTTVRSRLARMLEPRAPLPEARMAAVKQLREAGISTGVFASPLLPGVTDREGELEAVAEAAHEAGAQWFVSGVLFLTPSSSKVFMPFLQEKFPRLVERYRQWYTKNTYAPEEYRKKIAERVARLRQKYGFHVRPWDEMKRPVLPVAQLRLDLDGANCGSLGHSMSCAAG